MSTSAKSTPWGDESSPDPRLPETSPPSGSKLSRWVASGASIVAGFGQKLAAGNSILADDGNEHE